MEMEIERPRMLTTEPDDDLELESVADPETPEDLDPRTWLARDESDVVGRVSVRGGSLKVGALTQGEMEMLRKRASKPNPAYPRDPSKRIQDDGLLNRWVIAHAMSKAAGTAGTPDEVQPEALTGKLTGDLTELARKILKLSGFVDEDERVDLPFD